jgi:hypothetical protein
MQSKRHAATERIVGSFRDGVGWRPHPSPRCVALQLKIEPRLHFDGASAKCAVLPAVIGPDLAEGRVGNDVIDETPTARGVAAPAQVERIQQVVGVDAKLDSCAFAQDPHGRQPKRLAKCGIDVKVPWPTERVTANTGRLRQHRARGWKRSRTGSERRRCEILQAASRKVPSRT